MNKEMTFAQEKEMTQIIDEAKKVVEQYPDKEHYFFMSYLPDTNRLEINICDLTGIREQYGKDVPDGAFHAEVIKTISENIRQTANLKPNSPIFVVIYKSLKEIAEMNPQDIHNIIYSAFNQPVNKTDATN